MSALPFDVELVHCFRCPKCEAVGTFGKFFAIADAPARWLCKWCGYYWSEKLGEHRCVPDPKTGVWQFEEAAPGQLTPKEAHERGLARHADPWMVQAASFSF